MRAKGFLYLMSWLGLFFLGGCAAQQEFEAREQICQDNIEKDEAMKIARDVLTGMYFTIDKSDFDRGYIRTRPLAGGQFFEIWRQDNRSAHDVVESSLHTIQRVAELNFTPLEVPEVPPLTGFTQNAGGLCIDCEITVRRLSLPGREVDSAAGAHTMFSRSSSLLRKLELSDEQKKGATWVDLGADPGLQTEILNRIEKQIVARGPRLVSRTRDEK